MPNDPNRYQGRPLLRLLELYVLDAIGQLSPADGERLLAMTPKLQSIYKAEGDWRDVLASAMHLEANTPVRIREVWAKNQEIARSRNATLAPQQFAEMFVDQNWRD
jgi:hypothetical protein